MKDFLMAKIELNFHKFMKLLFFLCFPKNISWMCIFEISIELLLIWNLLLSMHKLYCLLINNITLDYQFNNVEQTWCLLIYISTQPCVHPSTVSIVGFGWSMTHFIMSSLWCCNWVYCVYNCPNYVTCCPID
jgi:hypothetical protein